MQRYTDAYVSYLKSERLMRPRSVADYLTALRLLTEKIDILAASTYTEVNSAILALKEERGWSGRTTAKYAVCVKNLYAWLHREGIIPSNPFPFHSFKKPRPREAEYLTEEDFQKLLSSPFLTLQDACICCALWDSAARPSELCALDQCDIDFKNKMLHIPREKSKGEYSDRHLPLQEATIQLIAWQIETVRANGVKDAIFVTRRWTRLDPRDVDEIVSKIGRFTVPSRPDPIHVTPRMFRHAFGIRMLKKYNVPQLIVMKWMGHSSVQMTNSYLHMSADDSRHFYDKFVKKAFLDETG